MPKFSVMINDTHASLAAVGEEDWLTSSRSIAELEEMLPDSEKVEWTKSAPSMQGTTKFEKFKNFLADRKKILDTIEQMGPKDSDDGKGWKAGGKKTQICGYCGIPNH